MIVRIALLAAGLAALAGAANAQTISQAAEARAKEITAELQAHSAAAKSESGKAAAAMEAGDKATACTGFKASRAEAGKVLDLFPQQREQMMIATTDTALAVARANKIDENHGVWITLASQLDERVKLACGS